MLMMFSFDKVKRSHLERPRDLLRQLVLHLMMKHCATHIQHNVKSANPASLEHVWYDAL